MLLALVAAAAIAAPIPPPPTKYVTDTPGLLGAETRSALALELGRHETTTGQQVRVWIWPTRPVFALETVEAWAFRTFNGWGLGRAGYDDGLAVFVFVDPPEQRITVGSGLELAIPDSDAVRIRRALTADLAAGRADEGITRAVRELMRLAR